MNELLECSLDLCFRSLLYHLNRLCISSTKLPLKSKSTMSESVATMPVERKRRNTSELAKLGSPTSAVELSGGRSTRSAAKGVAPAATPPKRRSGAKKEKVEVKKVEKKEKVEEKVVEKVEEEKVAAVPEPEVAEEKPEEVAEAPVEDVAAEVAEEKSDVVEPVAEVAQEAVSPPEPEPEPELLPEPEPEPEIAEEVAAPKEVVTIEADAADIIQPEAAPVDEVLEWMLARES